MGDQMGAANDVNLDNGDVSWSVDGELHVMTKEEVRREVNLNNGVVRWPVDGESHVMADAAGGECNVLYTIDD
jgi:uncharacterized protein (AIM24 family)